MIFQVDTQVSGGGQVSQSQLGTGPGGHVSGSRVSKRRSRSSGLAKSGSGSQSDRGGRESPIGAEREREFPTTKIGSSGGHVADQAGQMPGNGQDPGNSGYQTSYHSHGGHGGRCSGSHGVATPSVQGRSVITGDLVQSRDFHYTVEQAPAPVYRRPREVVASYPGGGGGQEARHMSSRSRNDSRSDNYGYVEHKSSPYHTGTLRTSVRGLPDDSIQRVRNEDGLRVRGGAGGGGAEEGLRAGRLDQNYMMVRAQSRLQDGYDRLSHRSDSRGDLLDSDHNSIYDHGLYYQPGQYNGFVRTCDGKFIRTNIPQHDFETLDTNFYRNSSAMHGTMRRPSKNRHQSHGNADYCCPSRDDSGGNMRASDQLQQSYATLRGRKYTEKTCGRGVGDNYGRNTLTPNFMDDARSVHSLADDFFLPGNGGRGGQQPSQHAGHSKTMSRSTDKSLDSLGLEEDNEVITGFGGLGLAGLAANLRSDEVLATMLKREPPDGKEKPEPPKHQKLENNSRKNSKCDLLDTGRAVADHTRDSHAGSVNMVETSGVHVSGPGLAHVMSTSHPPHTPLSKTDSASSSKRDSVKEATNNYLDSSNMITEEDLVSERLKDWWVYFYRRQIKKLLFGWNIFVKTINFFLSKWVE